MRRPITDELVLAIESRPLPGLQVQLARVTKREQPLLEFVDTGVPASAYTAFQVPDPDFLPFHRFGAPQATVYNRPPGSAGRDRYLLTNQSRRSGEILGPRAHRARVEPTGSRCSSAGT